MISTGRPLALITGATQGIGLAAAKALATKHSYHVIIGARNIETGEKIASELRTDGHEASVLQIDLTSETSVKTAITAVERVYGYLDVLVNNAGVLLDRDGLDTWELYTKTFMTNVIGTAVLSEGLVPLLRKAKAGPPRVVFVSSLMGSIDTSLDKTTPWYGVDYTSYDASKAAVNMLAVNFDRKLADVGGKVNSVCPGYINTGLTKNDPYGETAEAGATRLVDMATVGTDGPSATFTNRQGTIAW